MEDINHLKTLFVSKLDTLKARLENLTNYALIEASQELRSFLFDAPCLLDILSKDKPFRVEFMLNDTRFMDEEEGAIASFYWRELYPNGAGPKRSFTKEQFLKYDCIHYNNKKFTVLQLIKFYAFVKGGIHLKAREKPEYNDLQSAFDLIKINGGLSALDHTMRGIIQVTAETLEYYKERLLYA